MFVQVISSRRQSRRGLGVRRMTVGVLVLAWLTVGLVAAGRYVEDYYQHRGFSRGLRPLGVPAGKVTRIKFYSPALGRMADYLVYVPTHYDPSRRYPVFYLLHGSPGRPQDFIQIASIDVRLDTLVSRRRVMPMILVFPDGRIGGSMFSDSEWADTRRGRFKSYVLDVVRNVDARFPTLSLRTARVIGGYSEGGFGATNIALRHLDTFAGIESWSGYFVDDRSGVFAHASQAQINANSPLYYASGLGSEVARYPLRAFFYAGMQDPTGNQMAPLVNELHAIGAQAQFARFQGFHDWGLWRAHVDMMLEIASRDFLLAPRRTRALSHAAQLLADERAHLAAAQAHVLLRRQAAAQELLLKACRPQVGPVLRAGAPYIVGLSRHGLGVVKMHLIYNCEVFFGQITPVDVPVLLCRRLPAMIAIVRRAAHQSLLARQITARCMRLTGAASPATPLPPTRRRAGLLSHSASRPRA